MSVVVNRVRRGFYADSVALMRIARALSSETGVLEASLMIGSPSNKALLAESGLLAEAARDAQADDLVIAVRARDAARAEAALEAAERLLAGGGAPAQGQAATESAPGIAGFGAALDALPAANLALISVPGEFAALEARRALERGLNVMIFSDNVPLAEEVALKRRALERGLLVMGPDCGTALIGGVPLAFANAVPRGEVGIVSASGTGLQEVSCLLARAGCGVSQGIGVGGRDLSEAVGGLMTLAALDLLESDRRTKRIVVISKPPSPAVMEKVLARAARCRKPVVLCLLGAEARAGRKGIAFARTLEAAACAASGKRPARAPAARTARRGWIRGLYSGGTLCAEAQVVLMDEGHAVQSNAPVPGAQRVRRGAAGHRLIDLGADEYTRGRPHPMIDPTLRNEQLARVLRERGVAAVLLDVVIGTGAHPDPAGMIAQVLRGAGPRRPAVIASVTGTDADAQGYARQVATLRAEGAIVARSNAEAARIVARMVRKPSRSATRRR
ncbi:MAG: acyl-CoA synthetase FdrA [Betaproteobacteria bacterium]|nr:acyl-CoA synthetase FdrA [Betaproteobacteria bacterium]